MTADHMRPGRPHADASHSLERVTRRRVLVLTLTGAGGVALLAACAPAAPAQPAPTSAAAGAPQAGATAAPVVSSGSGKTFVFARSGDSVTLDPPLTTENESERAVVQVCEGLLMQAPGKTELQPGLAEKWDTSPDGKVWTFTLRKGVKFHDGTDFNADAVVFNFDRWRLADNPFHQGSFSVWKTTMGDYPGALVEAKALDASTVRLTLDKPLGAFDSYLAAVAYAFTSPTAIQADPANVFKKPIGTGAFKFVEWKPGDRIVLERFDGYWGQKPGFDQVVMRVIQDPSARFLELKAGTIDAMDDPNPDDLALADADPNLHSFPRDFWPVGTLNLNHLVKPLDDVRVRQALAYGIDRPGLMPLYAGQAQPGNQDQTPASWSFNPDLPPIAYDPAKAKDLLAQAGHPDGFDISFWYMPIGRPYFPKPKEIAEKMADDLGKIGVRAQLKTEDWGAYMTNRAGKYDMWLLGGWASTSDPSWLIYDHWGSKKPAQGNYDNPQVRDLMNRAQFSIDRGQRTQWYREAAQLIYNDMAMVPVVFARAGTVLARKRVQSYPASPLRQEPYRAAALGD